MIYFRLMYFKPFIVQQKMKTIHQDRPFQFVATLSAVSFVSMPGYALYSSTKAALKGFIDGYRYEMSKGQILQSVYPVATETNFFNRAKQTHKPWPVQSSMHVTKSIKEKIIYTPQRYLNTVICLHLGFLNYIIKEKKDCLTH